MPTDPDITVLGDGEPSDDEIAALARLLLAAVEPAEPAEPADETSREVA